MRLRAGSALGLHRDGMAPSLYLRAAVRRDFGPDGARQGRQLSLERARLLATDALLRSWTALSRPAGRRSPSRSTTRAESSESPRRTPRCASRRRRLAAVAAGRPPAGGREPVAARAAEVRAGAAVDLRRRPGRSAEIGGAFVRSVLVAAGARNGVHKGRRPRPARGWSAAWPRSASARPGSCC